ncbi:MAG TPA: GNAT family N-acetyltransferase [Thermoanaerobaculia bacterium]|nr:GNAT family N-acetyltransferase [Thermoanaerobaculia bacterium]
MPGSGAPQRRSLPSSRLARPSLRPARGRLHLRWATVADLPTLVRHRRRMWAEIRRYPRAWLDDHDVVYARWVRRLMVARRFLGLLVEDAHGTIVGSGGLWLMPAQPRPGPLGRGEMPYILSMYTEPAYRGRGVASRIVRAMVRWARGRRYGRIVLHASRFGRPVYNRLGFEDGSEMRMDLLARRPPTRRTGARRRTGPRSVARARRPRRQA